MRKLWIAASLSLLALPFGQAADSPKEEAQQKAHRVYLNTYTRGWFVDADKNGDGYLTLAEYSAAEKSLKGATKTSRFRHADTNGDQLVSFDEAKAQKRWEIEHHPAIEKVALDRWLDKIKESDGDLYASLVAQYDADGDGALTVTEMRPAIVALGKPKSALLVDGNHDGQIDAVERLRKWIDKNHDGTIGPAEAKRAKAADLNDDHKIGPKERALWRKKTADLNQDHKVDAKERHLATKKVADRNRDGTVDRVERRKAFRARPRAFRRPR